MLADLAATRALFLADVSKRLALSLDYAATLEAVRAPLPEFADWCIVDLVDAEAVFKRVAVAHADPAQEAALRELALRNMPDVSALEGVPRVMRTGELQLVRASDDPLLCQTGTGSGIIAPLVATISHDLKNPLATVRGQAQLLSCSSSASRSSWFDLR